MIKEITSDIYHLLHPKIAFFVTSIDKNGKPNVMTCAWGTPVSEEPPIVIVCIAKEAYTAGLIRQTKNFVINIPTKKLVKALWICGKISVRKTDKFRKAGLEIADAKRVTSPVIEGCAGYIECKLWKTVDAGECYAFFGKVVASYVDDRYVSKGLWTRDAGIPLHLGGSKIVYFG